MPRLRKAICPNCGAGLELDPQHEFTTCSYCGTRSFVETVERPVTEEIRVQQHPVIRIQPARSGCLASATGTLVLLVGGVIGFGYLRGMPYPQWLSSIPGLSSGLPTAIASVISPASMAGATGVDYFANAAPARLIYEQRIGVPIRAMRLVLYPTYALLDAQDPKNRTDVDSYTLMNGVIKSVSPVPLGANQAKLERVLFSIEDVNFALLASLVHSAEGTLAIDEAKPSHIIIERDLFGTKQQPVIKVYVSGPRGSGYVEYSLDGKKLRIAK